MHLVSHGALWFHGRSGWHENDLAGGVRGHGVRGRLRYRAPVSHKETGEGTLSLTVNRSQHWTITFTSLTNLSALRPALQPWPELDQETWLWINIELLTLRWWQGLTNELMLYLDLCPDIQISLLNCLNLDKMLVNKAVFLFIQAHYVIFFCLMSQKIMRCFCEGVLKQKNTITQDPATEKSLYFCSSYLRSSFSGHFIKYRLWCKTVQQSLTDWDHVCKYGWL